MSNLVPDNLIETLNYPTPISPAVELARANKPYEEYDNSGNVIGYSWYYGDTVQLDFHIDGKICVENTAIVYTAYGDIPTTSTEGFINQKCYNILDLKSWTCTSINDNLYTWTEDEVFTNPTNGGRAYYISAQTYLLNKLFIFKILNFRKQIVFESQQSASTDIYFNINKENSSKIARGTYTVQLECVNVNETEKTSIISGNDCQLFVR